MRNSLQAMLSGGDRRSLGRVAEVVALLQVHPERVPGLVELLWDFDSAVRMRAADALEKLSRSRPEILNPFKAELLGLMAETSQPEVRWHLASMASRMDLTAAQRRRAAELLEGYLSDRSSIVKTCAMQGLWELALLDGGLRSGILDLIRNAARTGTPAMRARGRKLLGEQVPGQ